MDSNENGGSCLARLLCSSVRWYAPILLNIKVTLFRDSSMTCGISVWESKLISLEYAGSCVIW